MNQFVKIWRGSMPRLAFAGLFAIASIGAQAQTSGGGGGIGFVPVPPVVIPQPLPAGINTLTWSKNASSSYALNQFTGDYYDNKVGIAYTSTSGMPRTYQAYVKTLSPSGFTRDSNGAMATGAISTSLTWNAQADGNVEMTGGSFTLSNIHWDLNATGSANVWATASGTGIATTDLLAFTVPAASVTRTASYAELNTLAMSVSAIDLMTRAIGANPVGLAYESLMGASSTMGKLSMSAVPEAATWAQLSLGLIGLGALARRKLKRCGAAVDTTA